MLIPMRSRLRVLLVQDAGLMRDALAALLAMEAAVEIIGAVANSAHAVRLALMAHPEVALVDFALTGGAAAVAALRERWPSIRIVLLTSLQDERVLDAALRAAVEGCILKSDTRAELMTGLRRLSEGHRHVSRAIRDRTAGTEAAGSAPAAAPEDLSVLTDREREIMQCVASGLRTREIALRLSLSHKTVEKHRSNLMRKLGLRSAAAVAAYAITKGYGRT